MRKLAVARLAIESVENLNRLVDERVVYLHFERHVDGRLQLGGIERLHVRSDRAQHGQLLECHLVYVQLSLIGEQPVRATSILDFAVVGVRLHPPAGHEVVNLGLEPFGVSRIDGLRTLEEEVKLLDHSSRPLKELS